MVAVSGTGNVPLCARGGTESQCRSIIIAHHSYSTQVGFLPAYLETKPQGSELPVLSSNDRNPTLRL